VGDGNIPLGMHRRDHPVEEVDLPKPESWGSIRGGWESSEANAKDWWRNRQGKKGTFRASGLGKGECSNKNREKQDESEG